MGRPLCRQSVTVVLRMFCSRGRLASACCGPGTHVLSFACFKASRNFKPLVVVDSTVSASALALLGVSYRHAAVVSIVHCTSTPFPFPRVLCAHGGGARVCRGVVARGGVGRWSNQAVARSPPPPFPHRAHRESSQAVLPLVAPAAIAADTRTRCTYRYFLSLRRSPFAFHGRRTARFPLRSAFHGAKSPSRRLSK